MTHHTDHNQSTSNAQQDTHTESDLGPTGRFHAEDTITEIRVINLDTCTADVIFDRRSDSNSTGGITFGFSGELRTEDDLREAVYHVYKAMYRARQHMDTKLQPADARPKLFNSVAEESPIAQAHDVAENLSKAAERGITDAVNNLTKRTKAEICYRILTDESHLDISNADPL